MVEEFQKCEMQSKAENLSTEPQTTVASNEHSQLELLQAATLARFEGQPKRAFTYGDEEHMKWRKEREK